jgi:hypothetical protein
VIEGENLERGIGCGTRASTQMIKVSFPKGKDDIGRPFKKSALSDWGYVVVSQNLVLRAGLGLDLEMGTVCKVT